MDVLTKMSLEASALTAAVTAADCSILLAGNTNGAAPFIATLFGVFIPVVFLMTLFIQSEARKAAESGSEGRKF
jgi:photosystem II reaction center protein PsbM